MNEEIQNHQELKKRIKPTKIVLIIILILFGSAVVFISVFAIGIYGFNWSNKFTREVEKIVPFPVAMTNYTFIPYSSFNFDLTTLIYYYQALALSGEGNISPSEENLDKAVLQRLIRNEVTKQIAGDFRVKVEKLELQQEMDKIITQSDTPENAEQTLKQLYNWTVVQYRDHVLYFYLLRSKLQDKLSYDDSLAYNIEAKKRVEEVLDKVKSEADTFENLAKNYSEDTTAAEGGNLGYITRGQMVAEFEEAAFQLKKDEVSDVVRTKYGFHIIKVLNIKGEGESEEREISHLLIKTQDLDEFIDNKLKDTRVYIFKKNMKWDKMTNDVVFPAVQK